jgi:hypothetical protein
LGNYLTLEGEMNVIAGLPVACILSLMEHASTKIKNLVPMIVEESQKRLNTGPLDIRGRDEHDRG